MLYLATLNVCASAAGTAAPRASTALATTEPRVILALFMGCVDQPSSVRQRSEGSMNQGMVSFRASEAGCPHRGRARNRDRPHRGAPKPIRGRLLDSGASGGGRE